MLSLQLTAAAAAVDWRIYSTADQIHKRIQTVAAANTAEAIQQDHQKAAVAATAGAAADDAPLAEDAAAAHSDWMQLRWAPSSDAPHEPTDIQVLRTSNPHVSQRAPITLPIGSSPAARLLTLWLQPEASDPAAAASTASSSAPAPAALAAAGARSALDPLRVLLNFGEHGREIISSEIALRLIGMLDIAAGEAAAAAAAAAAANVSASSSASSTPPELSPLYLSWLLSHVDLTIVPLLNVWSHRRIEEGHLCERKNSRGVDLNRNWNYLWNQNLRSAVNDKRDDQYPGPSAFSEPESRVLRDLAHAVSPDLYINYHSGIREMYCGWDHRSELIPNAAEVLKLLRFVSAKYCRGCPFGGAGAIGGYVVYGGSMDYIYDKLQTPYALTVEVFGGARGVHPSNCIEYFNPLTAASLSETTEEWARMSVESMAFLVREKKGVQFPYAVDPWMKPAADAQQQQQLQKDRGAAAAAAAANDASNHYSTFRELRQSLDGCPALHRLKLGSSEVSHQRTSWNDACTPFLPALAPLSSFGAAARLPVWSTGAAAAANSSDSSSASELRVLFVAGAVWNDLLSTQLLCSWLTASGTLSALSSSAASSLKIFVLPSLFSSFRSRLLEVPSMHAGFCSASLSADNKLHVLATQLSATESMLRAMRDTIRPHIVVHLSSESYLRPGSGSGVGIGVGSFQHVEASSLVAGDSEAEGQMLHRVQSLLQAVFADPSTPTASLAASTVAAAAGVSWSMRTHAEALSALYSSSSNSADAMRCEIGAIDVPRLLLSARHQPQQCPSCRLLLTVYLHGQQPPSSGLSSSAPVSISIAAERAESSWTHREREELQSRAKSDRVQPEEYRRPRSPASAFDNEDAATVAAATAESKRSVSMIGDRSSSASSSAAARSSSWCDFSPRNLAAHTPEAVLGLHVAQSQQVWNHVLLRGLLQPLAAGLAGRAEDAALWNPPAATHLQPQAHPSDPLAHALDPSKLPDANAEHAAAVEFVPPPWIGIALADLPLSLRSGASEELPSEPLLRAAPSDISDAASEAAALLAGRGSSVSTSSYMRILDRSRRVGLSMDEGFSASQTMTVLLLGLMILMAIVAWIAATARRRQQQKITAAEARRAHV